VKVQPELAGKNLFRSIEPVAFTAFLQEREVELVGVAAENLPGHLDVAVGRNVQGGRRRGLPERETERPAAEHIPVRDARPGLEPD